MRLFYVPLCLTHFLQHITLHSHPCIRLADFLCSLSLATAMASGRRSPDLSGLHWTSDQDSKSRSPAGWNLSIMDCTSRKTWWCNLGILTIKEGSGHWAPGEDKTFPSFPASHSFHKEPWQREFSVCGRQAAGLGL